MKSAGLIKLIATMALILFTVGVGSAQEDGDTGPALWEVSDADTTVHLFGTIHLMTEGVDWFTGAVERAFEESDTLVVEVNQTEVSRQEQQSVVRSLAVLPEGEQLSGIVKQSTMDSLTSLVEPMGVSPRVVERWKPWYAGLTVTAVLAQQAGFLPRYGVDVTLIEKASEREMEVESLESFQEQFELFDSLDREEGLYLLRDSLAEQGEIQQLFRDLRDAWMARDLETLESLILEAEDENPDFYRDVFIDRNERWTEDLVSMLEEESGTVFLAVGAGHLLGDDSVLRMLEDEGYDVTRTRQ